jgi:adenine-specific DNA-methyltransferase
MPARQFANRLKLEASELSTRLGGGSVLQFPYMGTKQALAPIVADIAKSRPSGPFLDAFAGMCSVANHVQGERSVWTNDLQCFAVTAARSMLCDSFDEGAGLDRFDHAFREHFDRLSNRFRSALRHERLLLATRTHADFTARFLLLEERLDRRTTRQFDLFSTTYANTYFGLEQAIELDALIYSLDSAVRAKHVTTAVRRRFLFALGRTLLRISTTTGHFAQYQTPSDRNWKRYQRTRRMSVFESFRSDYIKAYEASPRTPESNRAFNLDAVSLLRSLQRVPVKPAVIYADPPYKQDQYSRYYHLLETLVLYDYPRVTGKARYRANRPASVFSSKSKSHRGIEALAALSSSLGADFILSYPEDGIAAIRHGELTHRLKRHFSRVDVVYEGILRHSTMGASKGSAKQPVIERIYVGRN